MRTGAPPAAQLDELADTVTSCWLAKALDKLPPRIDSLESIVIFLFFVCQCGIDNHVSQRSDTGLRTARSSLSRCHFAETAQARTHAHTRAHARTQIHSGEEKWNVGRMPIVAQKCKHTQNTQMAHYITEVLFPCVDSAGGGDAPCQILLISWKLSSCAARSHVDVGGGEGGKEERHTPAPAHCRETLSPCRGNCASRKAVMVGKKKKKTTQK